MDRRALLASTASSALALGVAGCLGTGGGPDETVETELDATDASTQSGTDATTTTTTAEPAVVGPGDTVNVDGVEGDDSTYGGVDLQLGELSLQSSFVEYGWPSWNPKAPSDGLYAVLSVDASEPSQSLVDDPPLWSVVDGDRWDDGGPELAAFHAAGDPVERFAVPVPTDADVEDVEDVAIAIEGTDRTVHYPLDTDHLDTLRNPPQLTASASFPDAFHLDDPIRVTITVENTGDSAGTLAVVFEHDAISDSAWTAHLTASPDERVTRTIEADSPYEGSDPVHATARWGTGEAEATVPVRDPSTTTDGN